jgi:uncharacterized protein
MPGPEAELVFADELRMFLGLRHRAGLARVTCDGTSTLGHVVESLGVPLPEVGRLAVDGGPVTAAARLSAGQVAGVAAAARPQPLPAARFVLDVHLGTLARRLRLTGVDTAYANDRDDDALIRQANADGRVLLTQDRGLLMRRMLWLGAYVRGADPDDQLRDVLERFAPPLAPWTRCTACNGRLAPARKTDVEQALLPGTRRSYREFGRCVACGHVYWQGAHADRLAAIVNRATEIVARAADRRLRYRVTASRVSWSTVQDRSVSAVRWCGPRISDRNSAMSSRPQRSRYIASAPWLTGHPVRSEYRSASWSPEITHHKSRSGRASAVMSQSTRRSPACVRSRLPGWGSPCVMT